MSGRPPLLFYCQHSLGLGHLIRSYAIAGELARVFDVVLLSGGAEPAGIRASDGVDVVQLPPVSAGVDGRIGRAAFRETLGRRRQTILGRFRSDAPAAVIVELFPFGRKKFAPELLPLLEAAREARPRPVVICSLRDILVDRGAAQAQHDERASLIANAYFDAVAVHCDPAFARLEDSFRPRTRLSAPVTYTGFVVAGEPPEPAPDGADVVVSAGGGRVGEQLLAAAIEARTLLPPALRLRLIAGPFLPDAAFERLRRSADATTGIELLRTVPSLEPELAAAGASVSQCGYNTALDVLRSGLPALVVPFAAPGEDEQTRRAYRLAGLGAVRVVDAAVLDAARLAREIRMLERFRPRPLDLDLDGAAASAGILDDLVRHRLRGAA